MDIRTDQNERDSLFFKICFIALMMVISSFATPLKSQSNDLYTSVGSFNWESPMVSSSFSDRLISEEGLSNNLLTPLDDQGMEIQAFPNPTKGRLTLKWKEAYPKAEFTVMDPSGRVWIPSITINNGSRVTFKLPSGIYQLLLQVGDKKYTHNISVH